MKVMQRHPIFSFLIAFLILVFTPMTYAKNINLYDQPKSDAKVLEGIDSSNGMVPIFTPSTGDWIKVGDPSNGNVGWVKVSDLGDDSGHIATQISVSQRTIHTSKGPKTIQVMQFSVPKPLSPEQNKALTQQMQQREIQMEKSIQSMMQNFYQDMHNINSGLPAADFPVIVPVVVYPNQNPAPQANTHKSPSQKSQ